MMRPVDVQPIGKELAIKWEDGSEDYLSLEAVRRACPCASCQGETDILGTKHGGHDRPRSERAFQLVSMNFVGGYAIRLVWGDGHGTGLYSFDYLKRLAQAGNNSE